MDVLRLDSKYFPNEESAEYTLKMIGAKGSVKLLTKKTADGVDVKAQILASLLFPQKKLVDSEITTRLEQKNHGMELLRYVDNDFKSESRRQMEIKNHGIETRYTKFDEERGFIELPQGMKISDLVDPLSAPFLARDKRLLDSDKPMQMNILVRTGVLTIRLSPTAKRTSAVEGLGEGREQVRTQIELISDGQVKGPYLSPDLEIWLDRELGVITEIAYPFLGNLGKAALLLEKYKI